MGCAYLFVRENDIWEAKKKLVPGVDGIEDDRFGQSVAIYEDTALVGLPRCGNSVCWDRKRFGAAYAIDLPLASVSASLH